MSRYGTVNGKIPRRALRRGLLVSSSIACVLATGCSPLPPPPPRAAARDSVVDTVASGLKAFRDGDQTTVENDIQTLSGLLPADETDAVFSGCTPQARKYRRIERSKRLLEHLDDAPAPSMGDEEKYVYFQQLIDNIDLPLDQTGRVASSADDPNDPLKNRSAPSDFECEGAPGYQQSADFDSQEAAAIQTAGRDRMRAWLIDLRRTDDTQLNIRMQNAVEELYEANLDPFHRGWRPPGEDGPTS